MNMRIQHSLSVDGKSSQHLWASVWMARILSKWEQRNEMLFKNDCG